MTGLDFTLMLLAAAAVLLAIFARMRLPSALAYLLLGAVVGEHALGWLHHSPTTSLLGEIGVTFLLFTIGLEFSLSQLNAMRKEVLGLGSIQVLVGTISGGVIAFALGLSWQASLIAGGALALSSTAIVIKQLGEQLELQAPHGRLAVAVLLFQDLAAVPFLILIPVLASTDTALLPSLGASLAKGVVALLLVVAAGRLLLRPLYHEVGKASSPELFTITSLLVALAAAWLTHLMGLSLALGAFLAGMVLGETEYKHQVEVDIRPFRDLLLGLFFITVGMQLDALTIAHNWPWVALIVAGLVAGKGLLIVLLVKGAGHDLNTALRVGITLGQGGEFGLALLALATSHDLLSGFQQQVLLASIIGSMALAPLLIKYAGVLVARARRRSHEQQHVTQSEILHEATQSFAGHVIICGFGESGRHIADSLYEHGIDFVAIDSNSQTVKAALDIHRSVFFADASHPGNLEAVGLKQARAVVVTLPDSQASLRIVHAIRRVRGDLPVLVRAEDETSLDRLMEAGATNGVPVTFEIGHVLSTQLLVACGVQPQHAFRLAESRRERRYSLGDPGSDVDGR